MEPCGTGFSLCGIPKGGQPAGNPAMRVGGNVVAEIGELPGGDTARFLKLSDAESRFLLLKLALASGVRQLRERRGLTQAALADRLGSSQSRVAKMEAGDRAVSLDLLMRSLLTIGATASEIAKWIKRAESSRAA